MAVSLMMQVAIVTLGYQEEEEEEEEEEELEKIGIN